MKTKEQNQIEQRGVISRPLADHLDYVYAGDHRFQSAWVRMNLSLRSRYLRTLVDIEQTRLRLPGACRDGLAWHCSAARLLASQFSSLSERDFPQPPSPRQWIRFAESSRWLDTLHRDARSSLLRVVQSLEGVSGVLLYGGVKPRASIEQKIEDYRTGRAELDLWDLVRFRLVAANIRTACGLGKALRELFRERVVRCRNYYARPRNGWNDPYRALHFEVKLGSNDEPAFIEVQVVTLARDAVGMIDHGLIHKRTLAYDSGRHSRWLRCLSFAANIVDAGLN